MPILIPDTGLVTEGVQSSTRGNCAVHIELIYPSACSSFLAPLILEHLGCAVPNTKMSGP